MKRKKGKNVEKERKKTVTFFFFSSVTVVSDFCLFYNFFEKEFGKFDQTSPFNQCFIQLFQTLTAMMITWPDRNVWRSKAALAFKESLMRL